MTLRRRRGKTHEQEAGREKGKVRNVEGREEGESAEEKEHEEAYEAINLAHVARRHLSRSLLLDELPVIKVDDAKANLFRQIHPGIRSSPKIVVVDRPR